jgi:hypothetical protein
MEHVDWWGRDVVEAGKLPLALCLLAFVVTFLVTRTITRLIRAGRGPFHDEVTAGGTHIHHAIPGLILLILGAFTAIGTTASSWTNVAAVLIGIGVSLVLDEFALIFHLTDDYWTNEGRLSVDVVCLTAACLGFVLMGVSPFGVNDVAGTELAVRFGGELVLVVHGILILVCVLKGKYAVAILGLFVPILAWVAAVRLARPGSVWARRRYSPKRQAAASRRAATFDKRWEPILRRWQNLLGGAPSPPTQSGAD